MYNLIPPLLRKKSKLQGCIVVIGNETHSLSQLFVDQAHNRAMPVYQVQHDPMQTNLKIEQQDSGLKRVRLNLINPTALKNLVGYIQRTGHSIELCIFQADFSKSLSNSDASAQQVEQLWQNTGLAAVNIAQAIIRQMLIKSQGTLIFLGTQPNLIAENNGLTQSMFASIRALAQSLAREFHPKGIHIAYCMLESWDSQNVVLMDSVKNMCWHLYQQPDSTWSQELSVGV